MLRKINKTMPFPMWYWQLQNQLTVCMWVGMNYWVMSL